MKEEERIVWPRSGEADPREPIIVPRDDLGIEIEEFPYSDNALRPGTKRIVITRESGEDAVTINYPNGDSFTMSLHRFVWILQRLGMKKLAAQKAGDFCWNFPRVVVDIEESRYWAESEPSRTSNQEAFSSPKPWWLWAL